MIKIILSANNDFSSGRVEWFPDGKLNASYNCIDRHLETKRNQTAFIWEGDDPDMSQQITYGYHLYMPLIYES